MSPRRRIEADELDFFEVKPTPPRRWGLPVLAAVASVLMAAAITAATLILVSHTGDSRLRAKDAQVLDYVQSFMTTYTTVDPFNANAYVDRILAQGTGEFEKGYKERQNEILIRIAQLEPRTGTVVAAGVQQWRDDGSADVLVATKTTAKSPDGKSTIESGDRWVATAIKEGQQWKISKLIQVI